MKQFVLILLTLIFVISLEACKGSANSDVSFSYDIQPIFLSECIACHSTPGTANLDLTSYESLMEGNSNNGPVVVAGNPEQSFLFEKIAAVQPSFGDRMPQNDDPLPDEDIYLIELWILQGAEDN